MMARPELDQLRDTARGGRFQAVLINDVDRLARDVTHLGIIKRDLERQDVQLIFRKLPTDATPMSGLATQATSRSALRPRRFPISARVIRSVSERRNRAGNLALKIRFSEARYSFRNNNSWLTEPVT